MNKVSKIFIFLSITLCLIPRTALAAGPSTRRGAVLMEDRDWKGFI